MANCPEMSYFMNESECDVVFVIEGQRLPAEKRFLSIRNNVFRRMFSENFKDYKELVIGDTTFDAFKTLLQFIYTDQLVLKNNINLKVIEEVLKLSDTYQTIRLTDKMVEPLKTIPLTVGNIDLFSRIAVRYQMKELIERVDTFIEQRLDNIIKEDNNSLIAFNDSTHNQLLKVLAENHRKVRQELKEVYTKVNSFRVKKCKNCDEMKIKPKRKWYESGHNCPNGIHSMIETNLLRK